MRHLPRNHQAPVGLAAVRVGEVGHEKVALFEVLRAAELLPEPLGDLH